MFEMDAVWNEITVDDVMNGVFGDEEVEPQMVSQNVSQNVAVEAPLNVSQDVEVDNQLPQNVSEDVSVEAPQNVNQGVDNQVPQMVSQEIGEDAPVAESQDEVLTQDAGEEGGHEVGANGGRKFKMSAGMKRRRPSERILKRKLAKMVVPENGEGCSPNKPCKLD